MYLQGISCQTPEARFSQADCWEILQASEQFKPLKDRSKRLLEKVLTGDNGIGTRHFAMPQVERLFDLDAEELNRGFEREAPRLATTALDSALRRSYVKPQDVDALLICTCTGYLCPGVSSYVAEEMGMRSDVFLSDVVGLGCGAAIPLLRQAHALAKTDPELTIACVAVEICSAAFYLDDDPGVLISLCLFGDGAAASVWKGSPSGLNGEAVHCSHFDTLHVPEDRDLLRFENAEGKLRNRLHRSVPEKAATAVKTLFDSRMNDNVDILSHAGGRDVLDEVEKALGSPDLSHSRSILAEFGNMSSPSVLFALERFLENTKSGPLNAWATSFGAGFACHSCEFTRR
ncbi:MAG: stilbene synthase [Verrucomicrobiota bacterium]